ncbi:hypothetical protein D3C75_1008600 [compost metagenome]
MRQIVLAGGVGDRYHRMNVRAHRQRADGFQPTAQRRHARLITDVQLPGVIFRHHQRSARTPDRKRVAHLCLHRPAAGNAPVMDKEIERQLVAGGVIQRGVITRLRTHAVAPVHAFVGHHRGNECGARLREKDFGMVVEAAGAKAVQRLAA